MSAEYPAMLPPSTVQIKRKRTDDPVDLLHVQNEVGGIPHVKHYIFKRQRISGAPTTDSPDKSISQAPHVVQTVGGIPRVQISKPGDELRDPYAQGYTKPAATIVTFGKNVGQASQPVAASIPAAASKDDDVVAHDPRVAPHKRAPRRFHMSRPVHSPTSGINKKRGAKAQPVAVFIERKEPLPASKSLSDPATVRKPSPALRTDSIDPLKGLRPVTEGKITPSGSLRAKKQAGNSINITDLHFDQPNQGISASTTSTQNTSVKRSLTEDAEIEAPTGPSNMRPSPLKHQSPSLRIKPKKPAKKTVGDQQPEASQGDDSIMTDVNDADYVVDTYVRVAADDTEEMDIDPTLVNPNMGYLVLSTTDEITEFYAQEANSDEDSDNPYNDDDADSNAENYAGNDYPDEDFDEEDDDAPYRYRTKNASDEEEYGNSAEEDDEDEDDDEDGYADGDDHHKELGGRMERLGLGGAAPYRAPMRPWMKNLPSRVAARQRRRAMNGGADADDEDEDEDGETWN